MKKLGILVGDSGDWKFFNDIFDELKCHYEIVQQQARTYNTPLLHGRLNRWAYQRSLSTVLRRSDVVFVEWASELLVAASHMKKICPIITRLHSHELFACAPQVCWDNVDRVILVSKAMQRQFNALYPSHAHKSRVIYNGRPLDLFQPVEREFGFNLGMLAQINPRKRIYEVILMFADLMQQGYQAHLHIAGGRQSRADMDEYYVAMHRLVEKLELTQYVTFYEHVTDTATWLKGIDIFVSNSYWEGHQVALVEAMASGCYCLAHCWDGVEEVLPACQIYASEQELQRKIIGYSYLPEVEKRQHQSEMRAISLERYDLRQQTMAIREVIEELLK